MRRLLALRVRTGTDPSTCPVSFQCPVFPDMALEGRKEVSNCMREKGRQNGLFFSKIGTLECGAWHGYGKLGSKRMPERRAPPRSQMDQTCTLRPGLSKILTCVTRRAHKHRPLRFLCRFCGHTMRTAQGPVQLISPGTVWEQALTKPARQRPLFECLASEPAAGASWQAWHCRQQRARRLAPHCRPAPYRVHPSARSPFPRSTGPAPGRAASWSAGAAHRARRQGHTRDRPGRLPKSSGQRRTRPPAQQVAGTRPSSLLAEGCCCPGPASTRPRPRASCGWATGSARCSGCAGP